MCSGRKATHMECMGCITEHVTQLSAGLCNGVFTGMATMTLPEEVPLLAPGASPVPTNYPTDTPTFEPTDVAAPTQSPVQQLDGNAFEMYCQEELVIDKEVIPTPFIQDNGMGGDFWKLTSSQSSVFQDAFNHLDVDDSGTLNADELAVDFSHEEIEKVLASCDHNEMNFGVFTLWREGGFVYNEGRAGEAGSYWDDDMRGIYVESLSEETSDPMGEENMAGGTADSIGD